MRTLLLLNLMACGDKADDTATTQSDTATTQSDTATTQSDTASETVAASGTVTMTATAEGSKGHTLIGFVWTGEANEPPAAAICQPLTSDKQTVTATLSQLNDKDPCNLSEAITFSGGEYAIFAGVFVEGEKFPILCTPPITVTVDGDTEIDMPAMGPCK